ncbi:MAG TPA: S26 family signal peptidase [Candidatus Saccharimonadales bacterium]|nr:S26 family signal peptidase [Candidatus Saccharimonadales bacterium]
MIYLRRVVGESMLPTLRPGTLIIAVRRRHIQPGDIVIIWHAGREKIKRVRELTAAELFVVGDNAVASTDSRNFGWLPRPRRVPKVIWPRASKRATMSED